MSLKLDINKAYDRVKLHFIEQVMKKMEFDETWIRKVMMCINLVSFGVLINGEPSDTICPSGGLRREEFVKRLRKLHTPKRGVRKWKHHARTLAKQYTPVVVDSKRRKSCSEEETDKTQKKHCRALVDIPTSPSVSADCRLGGDVLEHEISVVTVGQPHRSQ